MRTTSLFLLLTLISHISKGQLDIYRRHSPSIDSSDLVIAKLSKQKLYDNALTKLNESINAAPAIGINYFNRAVIKYYKFGENADLGVDTSIYNDCKRALNKGYNTPELHYLIFSLLHPNLALYDEEGNRTDVTFEDAKAEIDIAIEKCTEKPIKYRFARMLLLYQKLKLLLLGNEIMSAESKAEFKETDILKFDCLYVAESTKSNDKIGIANYIRSQISYSLEQDTIAAIQHLTDAILADTSKLQYVEERARVKYEMGNYRGAITDYEKFLVKAKRAEDVIILGNCYSLIKDEKTAITNYTAAISLIVAELKLIHENKNKPSTTDYERYAGDARGDHLKLQLGKAYFGRGLSYLELKNKVKACSDLNQSVNFGYKAAQEVINEACQ
jgi:tetratricopeptide (TPR) repeat protein